MAMGAVQRIRFVNALSGNHLDVTVTEPGVSDRTNHRVCVFVAVGRCQPSSSYLGVATKNFLLISSGTASQAVWKVYFGGTKN